MRIGVVGYTNSLPLADGLERHLEGAVLVRETPARIADALSRGELDLGLVPVATLLGHADWPVAPGLGIASRGAVRSVLLLSRVPRKRIKRLIEDPASRTSNLLARLWLREELGVEIEIASGAPDVSSRLEQGDATVLIGEDALLWSGASTVEEAVDLGEAWRVWTGMPFVFAVWAGPGVKDPAVQAGLRACYEENRLRLPEIAARAGGGDKVRTALLESYLTRNIQYRLGERERAGLKHYLSLAVKSGWLTLPAVQGIHADLD